jgi:protein-tyrosine-phosphatase
VMGEHGIDIAGRSSKHLGLFTGQRFDYVVSLCDRVREVCPEFPGHPGLIHWSIADPASQPDRESSRAFQRTAAEVATRVGFLLALIQHDPSPGKHAPPPEQKVH